MCHSFNVIVFFTLLTFAAKAQLVVKNPIAEKYAATITAEDYKKHIFILASDSLQGRETGALGQKMAAQYIANHFAKNQLKPVVATQKTDSMSWFQPVALEESQWSEVYVKIGKEQKEMLQDFIAFGNFAIPQEQKAEVVFAGFGIDDPKYSDYNTVDVTNRFAIILAGEPLDADSNYVLSGSKKPSIWYSDWRKKVAAAKERGAKGCFVVLHNSQDDFIKYATRYKDYFTGASMHLADVKKPQFPIFFTSPNMAAAMTATTVENLMRAKLPASRFKKERKKKKIRGIATSITDISLKASRKITPVMSENVLGYIEGTDKKDELIVISAHYDHLGKKDTVIYNGADDNGSGTTGVLEIAEAFAIAAKEGNRPQRSLLFMLFTGEEKGLYGSEYYVEKPVFSLKNTVANLNIDMIGRLDEKHKDNENYIYLIGSDKLSQDLHQISEAVNKTYSNIELDYTYNSEDDPNRFYYRSDHYNFAKNNIPVIFYFNGTHEDYHQPTDTPDKILCEKAVKISRLVFHTAWELANRAERIRLDKPVEEPAEKKSEKF